MECAEFSDHSDFFGDAWEDTVICTVLSDCPHDWIYSGRCWYEEPPLARRPAAKFLRPVALVKSKFGACARPQLAGLSSPILICSA